MTKKRNKIVARIVEKVCVKCGEKFKTTDPFITECGKCILDGYREAGYGRRRL